MSNFFLFSQESNLRAAFRAATFLFSLFILSALTVYTLTLLYPKDTCFKAGILAEQLDNHHYSLPHFLPKSTDYLTVVSSSPLSFEYVT